MLGAYDRVVRLANPWRFIPVRATVGLRQFVVSCQTLYACDDRATADMSDNDPGVRDDE